MKYTCGGSEKERMRAEERRIEGKRQGKETEREIERDGGRKRERGRQVLTTRSRDLTQF